MRRDRCRYRGGKRGREKKRRVEKKIVFRKEELEREKCRVTIAGFISWERDTNRQESWIDLSSKIAQSNSIQSLIILFIVWELIDIIIREDGIEFIMRDPYVVQFIPFYIDYLVKNLNDPFQRTASNWFELAIRIVISLLSIFPNRNRHSFSHPIGSSSSILRSLFLQNASFVQVSNTESSLQLSSNLA